MDWCSLFRISHLPIAHTFYSVSSCGSTSKRWFRFLLIFVPCSIVFLSMFSNTKGEKISCVSLASMHVWALCKLLSLHVYIGCHCCWSSLFVFFSVCFGVFISKFQSIFHILRLLLYLQSRWLIYPMLLAITSARAYEHLHQVHRWLIENVSMKITNKWEMIQNWKLFWRDLIFRWCWYSFFHL